MHALDDEPAEEVMDAPDNPLDSDRTRVAKRTRWNFRACFAAGTTFTLGTTWMASQQLAQYIAHPPNPDAQYFPNVPAVFCIVGAIGALRCLGECLAIRSQYRNLWKEYLWGGRKSS